MFTQYLHSHLVVNPRFQDESKTVVVRRSAGEDLNFTLSPLPSLSWSVREDFEITANIETTLLSPITKEALEEFTAFNLDMVDHQMFNNLHQLMISDQVTLQKGFWFYNQDIVFVQCTGCRKSKSF